jgi:hypothetical protein
MREQIIDSQEGGVRTEGEKRLPSSFDIYLQSIEGDQTHFEEVSAFVQSQIMKLQSQDKLPSAPMSDQDRRILVLSFIQAVDRGICLDDEESKWHWILNAARPIYEIVSQKR